MNRSRVHARSRLVCPDSNYKVWPGSKMALSLWEIYIYVVMCSFTTFSCAHVLIYHIFILMCSCAHLPHSYVLMYSCIFRAILEPGQTLYLEPGQTSQNHIWLNFGLISKFYISKESFFQAEFDKTGFKTV